MEEAKRIIVTGATGLIASRLCRELLAHGHTVVMLSRHPGTARTKNTSIFSRNPLLSRLPFAKITNNLPYCAHRFCH